MADVVHIYGAGDKAQEISPEKQQLIDDLERFIGDIRSGTINIRGDRVLVCYESMRELNGQQGFWPVGYRMGGMKNPFNVLESTGLLRWIAQNLQNNGGMNL